MSSREQIIRLGPQASSGVARPETPLASAAIGTGSASTAKQGEPTETEASRQGRPTILDIADHPLFEASVAVPLKMAAGCDALAAPDNLTGEPRDPHRITSSLDPLRLPAFPQWVPRQDLVIPETPCANEDDLRRVGGASSGGLSGNSHLRGQPQQTRPETARDVQQRMLREFSSALRGKFGLNEDNIRNIVDAAERLFNKLAREKSQDFQSLATDKGAWELGYEPGCGVFLRNCQRQIYMP